MARKTIEELTAEDRAAEEQPPAKSAEEAAPELAEVETDALAADDATPEPEAEAPAEDATPEPKPAPVEPPTMATRYRPRLAARWNDLPDDIRQEVLDEIAEALDAGEPAGAETVREREADEPPPQPRRDEAKAQEDTPPRPDPGPLSAEDVAVLQEYDEQLAKVLLKVASVASFARDQGLAIGRQALEVIQRQDGDILSLRDERQFEKAIDAHTREMRPLPARDHEAVCGDAKKLKTSGRVKTWDDAVELALYRRAKTAGPAGKAQQADQRLKVAASVTASGRGQARTGKPDYHDLEALYRHYEKHA